MTAVAARPLERRSSTPTHVGTAPATRPAPQPGGRPAQRPGTRPSTRPAERPGTRPGTRPGVRPGASPAPLAKRDLRSKPSRKEQRRRADAVKQYVPAVRSPLPASEPSRSERQHLRVVPRRRPITAILAPVFALVFTGMLGITVFQTRMAQQQVQLDQLQVAVDKAQARHQELVRSQAELRSPQRIGLSAHTLGLVAPSAVGFVTVDRATYVDVVAGSGALTSNPSDGSAGP